MNENKIPITSQASVITSVPQSSNTNDIIDLTETNDDEECGENSCNSIIRSSNSVHPRQRGRPAKTWRKTNSSKAQSESADDSICILYENIQPLPEIQVVNEVVIDGTEQNQSTSNDSFSHSPVRMDGFTEEPFSDFQQMPSLFPEISSGTTSNSYQPNNYSINNDTRAPHHSTLPSCKYAAVTNEMPSQLFIMPHLELQIKAAEALLNLQNVPSNLPSHSSQLEKPNITNKGLKIRCGICWDGPDEIASSDRNFTSTNCGHIFCNTCIKASMRSQKNCPQCRKKITAKSIHPLYF